jgi:transposase InsO family protein
MQSLQGQFPTDALAEALGVSPAGFAAHRQKPRRPRRRQDAELAVLIGQYFVQSRQTYGCLRLRADLRDRGLRCGKNRILRLMHAQGFKPRQKRRFRPRTTDSRHSHPIADNWLAKIPAPDRPGQVWQSDFTYIPTAEGWLYLAFTLDACSRRCVAHHCREDMAVDLTLNTFNQALSRCRPVQGLIHHSDRGSQYAATLFQDRLRACGVTASMSRTANPYDNALAESFVATLKAECFAGAVAPSKAAAKLMAFDYIESFYNRTRRHSSLNYLSPLQFENLLFSPNQDNLLSTSN